MSYLASLIIWIMSFAWFAVVPEPQGPVDEACPDYQFALTMHGLPDQFSYVAWRESRCDPTQINTADPNGGSFGLLQINAIHLRDVETRPHLWEGVERCLVSSTDDLLVAWKNICFGSYLYAHAGGDPWGVR